MPRQCMPILVALAVIACVAIGSMSAGDVNIFHVFLWLLVLLVASGAALWPRSDRDQRAELEMERANWADRIELPLREDVSPPRSATRVSARKTVHSQRAS